MQDETIAAPRAVAQAVIEAAALVMRMVRAEVGRGSVPGLTFTEMRTMGYLATNPGASLTEVAGHLGVQKPTASKAVESLVARRMVSRGVAPGNRRRHSLRATALGQRAMEEAAEPAVRRVAVLLARLTADDRETLERAMAILQALLAGGGERPGGHGP